MKTFEEAMEQRKVGNLADVFAGVDALNRYQDLIREITTSELTREFLVAMVEAPWNDDQQRSDKEKGWGLLMSAFVNGVMIGMEMEKGK